MFCISHGVAPNKLRCNAENDDCFRKIDDDIINAIGI
jgi:hypothetical protein